MPYIEAQDRNQMMMCPLDSMVDPESIARIIDKFVDGLNLESMGFKKTEAAAEGREVRPEQKPKRGHYEVKKIVKLVFEKMMEAMA